MIKIKTILTKSLSNHKLKLKELTVDEIPLFDIIYQSINQLNQLEQEIKRLENKLEEKATMLEPQDNKLPDFK